MNLEEQLRSAFKEETTDLLPPPELKIRIMDQVTSKQGGRRMKKWLLPCILAAVLLIPTGAYATYNYLADSIYDSQANTTHIGGTQQKYDELEAKLQEAKQILSEEDFTAFMPLLKELGEYNLKFSDSEGVLHPEQMNAEEHEKYKTLTMALEPFFNKLNNTKSPPVNTQSSDEFWDSTLTQAQSIFSTDEFEDFKSILSEYRNQIQHFELKTVDPDGSIHNDRLSTQYKENLEQLNLRLKPYFDKLGIQVEPTS